MKLILFFLAVYSISLLASPGHNQCSVFYANPVQALAYHIVQKTKSDNLPLSAVLLSPEIQRMVRELRALVPSADLLLKGQIKTVINREAELEKLRTREEPRPPPQKVFKKIFIEGDYAPALNISHLFHQNPDNVSIVGGALFTSTRHGVTEIVHPKKDGSFIKADEIEKRTGAIYDRFTLLPTGRIAFHFNMGRPLIEFLIPQGTDILPPLPIPIKYLSKMTVLPNGKMVAVGYEGLMGVITEPPNIHQKGSYVPIQSFTTTNINDFAVFKNNDLVAGAEDGGLWYYAWQSHLQTHTATYPLVRAQPVTNVKQPAITAVERLKDDLLATSSDDGIVKIWKQNPANNNHYEVVQTIPLGTSMLNTVRELPNGNLVVTNRAGKVFMLTNDGSGHFNPSELTNNPMIALGDDVLVLPNGDFITYGHPTVMEYTDRGYSGQVKEVHVWRPHVREIEIEVLEEDLQNPLTPIPNASFRDLSPVSHRKDLEVREMFDIVKVREMFERYQRTSHAEPNPQSDKGPRLH